MTNARVGPPPCPDCTSLDAVIREHGTASDYATTANRCPDRWRVAADLAPPRFAPELGDVFACRCGRWWWGSEDRYMGLIHWHPVAPAVGAWLGSGATCAAAVTALDEPALGAFPSTGGLVCRKVPRLVEKEDEAALPAAAWELLDAFGRDPGLRWGSLLVFALDQVAIQADRRAGQRPAARAEVRRYYQEFGDAYLRSVRAARSIEDHNRTMRAWVEARRPPALSPDDVSPEGCLLGGGDADAFVAWLEAHGAALEVWLGELRSPLGARSLRELEGNLRPPVLWMTPDAWRRLEAVVAASGDAGR